eukprot:6988911-Pyramimonas_sp.AAC.1
MSLDVPGCPCALSVTFVCAYVALYLLQAIMVRPCVANDRRGPTNEDICPLGRPKPGTSEG